MKVVPLPAADILNQPLWHSMHFVNPRQTFFSWLLVVTGVKYVRDLWVKADTLELGRPMTNTCSNTKEKETKQANTSRGPSANIHIMFSVSLCECVVAVVLLLISS